MGDGFAGSAPLGDPGLTPAPDVPPDNDFDPTQFFNALVASAQKAGVPGAAADSASAQALDAYAKELKLLKDVLPDWLLSLLKDGETKLESILDALLALVFILLKGPKEVVGNMAGAWVGLFAAEQAGRLPGEAAPRGSSVQGAAAEAFDSIMRPIGLLGGGVNPAETGSGQKNAEFVLGSLVNLHLDTWVIDVLGKVTGWGIFEWLHSFDEAITGAMNTRGMARLAFRPFMNTFMVQPLTRDLNAAYPIAHPSASSLVKAYLRGSLDSRGLHAKLSELGYGPDVVEQLLLDSSKELPPEILAWLSKQGQVSTEHAIDHLKLLGYVEEDATAVLNYETTKHLYEIWRQTAMSVVEGLAHGILDWNYADQMLTGLGLTDAEKIAYQRLAEMSQRIKLAKNATKPPKPGPHLQYDQVVRAYQEGILSLDDVYTYLEDRGYGEDDTRTLVLLDFTEADLRSQRHAELGALYRTRAVTASETATKAVAKADQAKASAYQALAAKYAKLAARYGG